ncbi:hypothetical protein CLU79DRAFT_533639 [Phycomyces nitens]|nr:hypothetical protein CLU79DRAFT_41433 [Phycomyces nitens]KAI9007866.1 hypothetical protein CLU79DRAFT_533639 [Phycomyces nitens]
MSPPTLLVTLCSFFSLSVSICSLSCFFCNQTCLSNCFSVILCLNLGHSLPGQTKKPSDLSHLFAKRYLQDVLSWAHSIFLLYKIEDSRKHYITNKIQKQVVISSFGLWQYRLTNYLSKRVPTKNIIFGYSRKNHEIEIEHSRNPNCTFTK